MKPLILDFVTPKMNNDFTVPFTYDEEKCVNIVNIDGVDKAFIDLNPSDTDVMTKTKAQRESEDDHFAAMELATKTKYGESEDLHDYLMELQTKTLKARESDE